MIQQRNGNNVVERQDAQWKLFLLQPCTDACVQIQLLTSSNAIYGADVLSFFICFLTLVTQNAHH